MKEEKRGVLMRSVVLFSFCFLIFGELYAQPPSGAVPTFAVATIKPLVERFHVVMHKERKILPVYALIADRPKLTKSSADPSGIPVVAYSPRGELHVGNATMTNLADFLQRFVLDRPAIDQTDISGHFDVALQWTPDNFQADGKAENQQVSMSAPPSLFTAIKEQLGLKLQPTKVAIDVFVIDGADQPSAN